MSKLNPNQTTVAKPCKIVGKGLHSGRIVTLHILPAPANFGIKFLRTDVEGAAPIAAHFENISSTQLNTTIGFGPSCVSTIEHLMAAFVGTGISNALVKLNGPEVPILDGSSDLFVAELLKAGVQGLNAAQKLLVVKNSFEYIDGDQSIRLEASTRQRIKCSIDFEHSPIGFQSIDFRPNYRNFVDISKARTFCHFNDVTAMRERGLALGGSLENAIVISDEGIMNPEGLRSPSEFVQHKLLDLIGDLALLGAPVIGDVIAYKPGHRLSADFMKELGKSWGDIFELTTVEKYFLDLPVDQMPSKEEIPMFASLA